jgi:hypothetical protein
MCLGDVAMIGVPTLGLVLSQSFTCRPETSVGFIVLSKSSWRAQFANLVTYFIPSLFLVWNSESSSQVGFRFSGVVLVLIPRVLYTKYCVLLRRSDAERHFIRIMPYRFPNFFLVCFDVLLWHHDSRNRFCSVVTFGFADSFSLRKGSWIGVATAGVGTLGLDMTASWLVPSLNLRTMDIESFVGISTLVVDFWTALYVVSMLLLT